jgi:hypothetical protein
VRPTVSKGRAICADDRDTDTRLTAPRMIVEVLSPATRDYDLRSKKEECRALRSVDTILFVDPGEEWVTVSQRIEGGWIDTMPARRDVALPSPASCCRRTRCSRATDRTLVRSGAMASRAPIPTNSIVFGYGPMLPLVTAGLGAWMLPAPWGGMAVRLAIIWGALILSFIGGVRRGFGFARAEASTAVELAAAVAYVTIAGLALLMPYAATGLAMLAAGYALAALLDRRAALRGDAPAHFARLRVPQLLLGCVGLAACWAWVVSG